MIIVTSKEDIKPGMYCVATESNFNKLKKLGFQLGYNNFENYLNNPTFRNSDIFTFKYSPIADWEPIVSATSLGLFEFQFQEETGKFNIQQFGFEEPMNFKAQIFTRYMNFGYIEFIGSVNGNVPAKWDINGICLNLSSEFNLYKEYKQRIYTKPNSPGFYPKQKFKISWTEAMSKGLEQSGWKLATNEEIDGLKN